MTLAEYLAEVKECEAPIADAVLWGDSNEPNKNSGVVVNHFALKAFLQEFRRMAAIVEEQAKALEKIRNMKYCEDDWDEPGLEALDHDNEAQARIDALVAKGEK